MSEPNPQPASAPRLTQITAGVFLAILMGWVLVVGQAIILPALIGVISVYLWATAAKKLAKLPGFKKLSDRLLRIIVVILFLLFLGLLIAFMAGAARVLTESIPRYTANFENLTDQVMARFGFTHGPDWEALIAQVRDRLSVGQALSYGISTITGFGSVALTALLYAVFLLADWDDLPAKTRRAFSSLAQAEKALEITQRINARIGQYLLTKTLVNVILAAISYGVMLVLGIEFPIFWAVLIGLLNYIPYIGSFIGVLFPAFLALVQFASFGQAAVAFGALMAAQLYVGNVLEPKMVGRSVNMSAFVVLLSLAFWATLWGAVGAILAVPLTSMVMIVLAEIPGTRPIAVMMSETGEV